MSDLIPLIKSVVREMLAAERLGTISSTQNASRASARLFGSNGPMDNLRLIQPYGFASRPKSGTECLLSPVGFDSTHLNVSGCFDSSRPAINDGEAVLYGPDGQVVYMQSGGNVLIGSTSASEPLVLGNVLKSFLDALLQALITGPLAVTTTPGNPAPTHPTLIAALTSLKSQYVDTSTTNVLSGHTFTQR